MKILIFLVIIALLYPVYAERVGVEVVSVYWGDENPTKAYPGDVNVPLTVKIKNSESKNLGALRCTLRFSKPLYFEFYENGSILRKNEQKIVLGGLRANATATLRYSISIDENAYPGIYKAELEVVYVEDPIKKDVFPIYLTVHGKSELVVEEYKTEPEKIYPGDEAKLKIKVRNIGNVEIKDVEIRISTPKGISTMDLGYKYLQSLKAYEEKEIKFKIKILGDAEPNVYTIPLHIKYIEGKKEKEKKFNLTVVVDTPASFAIASLYFEPFIGYEENMHTVPCCREVSLEFDVINTANVELDFVEVSIGRSEKYTVVPESIYIGTLAEDDFSTVKFTLNFKKEGKTEIPVYIFYTDKNNKRKHVEKKIEVYVKGYEKNKKKEGIISRFIRWLLGL